LYAQWLAMALQAMGVTPDEFQDIEHNADAGYGHPYVSGDYQSAHADGVVENATNPLPFIGA
jgi:hypothetical protein